MQLPSGKKAILAVIGLLTLSIIMYTSPLHKRVAEPILGDTVVRGEVTEIIAQTNPEDTTLGFAEQYTKVKFKENGVATSTIIRHGGYFAENETGLKVGEKVVLARSQGAEGAEYVIVDRYRTPWLIHLSILFIAIIGIVGGKRGLRALIGLAITVIILFYWLVPQLAAGVNPVAVTLGTSVAIALVAMYVAHGISKRTTIALGSTIITLLIGVVLAVLATKVLQLSGLGSEETVSLQLSAINTLDISGILLAGIILGALGVLDDVTTTQTATVFELNNANPDLRRSELFKRASIVGREHIASIINTLFLAYAATALPLLLIGYMNSTIPLWAWLNSEAIAQEIVRTLVGSTALILAVPISTLLASFFVKKPTTD